MAKTSKTWDISRFFQTLSFFESIPILSSIQTMFFGSAPPPAPQPQTDNLLLRFTDPQLNLTQTWGSLDDVVMGGVSQSLIQPHPEGLKFAGYVSTDNSGGFASIRSKNFAQPLNLAQYQGLTLTLKGDGQRYKFFVRDSDQWDSLAYAISFDTQADQWTTLHLPFADMQPVLRAKIVGNAPPLRTDRILSFQIMLSKFEYDGQLNPHFRPGDFQLLWQSIGVF